VVMAACPDGVRRASLAKLLMGDDIHSDGAVGVLFPPEFPRQLLCSVGFTPIGPKFVVGGVGGQRIRELASQPAAEVLSRTLEGLAPNERAAAAQGLHLRWIVPPVSDVESFGLPELGLVLGVDGDSVVFAGDRPAGANSIQFQLRDQESVDSDLRRVLGTGAGLLGGLFLVADRPERGGSEIDHIGQDAQIISEGLSSTEVLGLRCGEVALLDRGEFRSANRAVTILGLSG
ncbi:MAG TPA: FIST N-terminal domain-containing protein, partial [Microthrixaceae bacterium]|nr:FIST N-terminal domain-containing protein [Microthrixaceae bacterium]